jgi:Rps23 Pro-64 3,4-dihydroxylase Tpa1-like proline 4-hydroxylase|tara:strand:- start:3 stop:509 length:507 start_codon:yes stop_codon:yes gene_type:complete
MFNVKYIKNILSQKLIADIKSFALENTGRAVWSTNHLLWAEPIVRDSSSVDILNLKNTVLEKKILSDFKKFIDIEKYNCIGLSYYRWHPGSFIPFHNDKIYELASSVYLTKDWDSNYGGLFLYEDKKELKALVPKYNHAVINSNSVVHGTSIVSPKAPIRETLQLFFQ